MLRLEAGAMSHSCWRFMGARPQAR
jgi:hypothetical protein